MSTNNVRCTHMEFEGDPVKELQNFAKHGVDFSTVPVVFRDPKRMLLSNRDRFSAESRYQCIGFDGFPKERRGSLDFREIEC